MLMVEMCALSNGVEHGLRIHAALVDIHRQLNIRRWGETASASMGLVWFADCACLTSGVTQHETNRHQTLSNRLVGFEAAHLGPSR